MRAFPAPGPRNLLLEARTAILLLMWSDKDIAILLMYMQGQGPGPGQGVSQAGAEDFAPGGTCLVLCRARFPLSLSLVLDGSHARAWPWERSLKGEPAGSCCRMLSCLKSSWGAPVDSRTMPVMTRTSGVQGSA